MMATTHILAGAAVARVLRRPQGAWPGALASYLILDVMPHVNLEQYFAYPARGYVSLADAVLGLGLAAWLLRGQPDRVVMAGGVAVVVLVGLATNAAHLLLWFSRLPAHPLLLHGNHAVGIAMQVLVLAAAVLVLWRPFTSPGSETGSG